MSSIRLGDTSSEDSNIVTYFQTFEHYNSIVNSKKHLFQTLSKIDMIIKDGIDLKSTQIVKNLNDIYNLIGISVSIVETNELLFEDFKDYFMVLCNRLLIKLFVGHTFNMFYNLTNEYIDFIWQVQRLLKTIFTFSFTNTDDPKLMDYKFPVGAEVVINILKFLQLPLFKYMRSEMDHFIYETIDSHIARPNEFFRGKIKRGYLINQEIELLDQSLLLILENCDLNTKLLQYFHNTLTNKPTHFSYEVYERNFNVIDRRLENLERSKQNELLFTIANTIKTLISNAIVKTMSTISSNRGFLHHSKTTDTVQIRPNGDGNQEIVSFKAPNWVNYIQFQDIGTQQNSDYKHPSPQSTSSETYLMDLEAHRGFRQKLKHLFWNNHIK